jgi:hypothetical protein
VLEARGASERLTFYVDDRRVASLAPPFRVPFRLTRGAHRVHVVSPIGRESERVNFEVR